MSKLTLTNEAPAYIQRKGGANLNLTLPCYVSVTAIRETSDAGWSVFLPAGEIQNYPAHLSEDQMVQEMKVLLRRELIKSLAALEE